jgi:hypothetical protein
VKRLRVAPNFLLKGVKLTREQSRSLERGSFETPPEETAHTQETEIIPSATAKNTHMHVLFLSCFYELTAETQPRTIKEVALCALYTREQPARFLYDVSPH